MQEESTPTHNVRIAQSSDAKAVGRLLHDFNQEFSEPTPGPGQLAERITYLLEEGGTAVLLGGNGPDGVAVLRFRPAIWSNDLECYLAELYVVPAKRGQGLGRALLQGAMDLARSKGASYMDLGTGEDDKAARSLYEGMGFTNRDGGPGGPLNFYYEREL